MNVYPTRRTPQHVLGDPQLSGKNGHEGEMAHRKAAGTEVAESAVERYDVAILGGGIAGLTLALQLKDKRPGTSIIVVEKNQHPVTEAAHKVGESTVEVGGSYLRDVLHLGDYLDEYQLNKFGLRIFCSEGDNSDIARRPELGARHWASKTVGTYQLDRGRLENKLGRDLPEHGICFRDGVQVEEIALRPEEEYHRVRLLSDDGQSEQVDARWLVDASGRRALLKRQLGLGTKVDHEANAVWFRVKERIDVGQWSDDPEWHGKVPGGPRMLSTNHLVGPGYWVWIIPLASESTSIGIVTEAHAHRFDDMNRLDRAIDWLRAHEPQLAGKVEPCLDEVQDFRVMRNYSYGCEQTFSSDRWALAGEAGVFLDPFYSPGLDLVAIGNNLIGDLVTRSLDGEGIEERAAIHNQVFLLLFEGWLKIYEQQYSLLGSARVILTKVVWDTAAYWAIPGLIFFHDKWRQVADHPPLLFILARFSDVSTRIQRFFREWQSVDQSDEATPYISFYDFEFTAKLHVGMAARLSDTDFLRQIAANLRLVEQISGQLIATVTAELSAQPDNEGLRKLLDSWKSDPSLTELVEIYEKESADNPVTAAWIAIKRSSMSD